MTAGGAAVALASTPGALLPPWVKSPAARGAIAVAVIVAGIYLSKLVVRLLGRPVARRFRRESLAQTVLRSLRLAVVALTVILAAGIVGFRATDILLSVTVFSAVLGLVLAPIVGNVINGLFVLADQPYEIGDMIQLQDGTRGFVDDITIRYTKVFTLDNTFIVIPNSSIRDQQIVNYSAEDERTRLALPLLVTYESDIDAARALFERAARNCEDVVDGGPDIRIGTTRYPAKPTAYLDEYADDGILITLRYWAVRPYKLLTVRSRVLTSIQTLMEESDADIEIAYPHRQLVLDDETADAVGATRTGRRRASPPDAAARGTPREDGTGAEGRDGD